MTYFFRPNTVAPACCGPNVHAHKRFLDIE